MESSFYTIILFLFIKLETGCCYIHIIQFISFMMIKILFDLSLIFLLPESSEGGILLPYIKLLRKGQNACFTIFTSN